MSGDENIKKFTLVGGKSELDALATGGKRASRKRQTGGGDQSNIPPGPSYQMTAQNISAARAPQQPVQVQAPLQAPTQNGGVYHHQKNVKVVLTPKKKTNNVVLMAPKKKEGTDHPFKRTEGRHAKGRQENQNEYFKHEQAHDTRERDSQRSKGNDN